MAVIELGEWLPDQPELGSPGCTKALNVLPAPRGFRPLMSKALLSDAVNTVPLGAASAKSPDRDSHVYCGTSTKLYELSTSTWGDVSLAANYTNTATYWDFAQYGEIMLATNGVDNPQFIDMDVGALFANLTTDFQAKYVATIRDFAVFGYTTDAVDGTVGQRVRWSAIGDYTDYTISASTQADFQDTPGGGAVQRIFGGEYGVVMFENSIVKMTYVGSPVVFQFDDVSPDKGLYTYGGAAQDGDTVYFLDNDGFYSIIGGQQVQTIGNEKVDKWFFDNLDASNKDRISCAIDHENNVATWAFPGPGNIDGKPNLAIMYDPELQRWSYSDIDSDMIFNALSVGYTLDGLDNLSSDLDTLTISLDSKILFEGYKFLGVFDDFKLNGLYGSNLTATIETKEQQESPARGRSVITEAWPLVDGGTTTIAFGTRNRQEDDVVWGDAAGVNAVGFCPHRSEGRYSRARMTITGLWDEAQGLETVGGRTGGR